MPDHDCDKGDQLDRIEQKLDSFLEGLTELKGRVLAHEMVAGAVLACGGLVAAFWALAR